MEFKMRIHFRSVYIVTFMERQYGLYNILDTTPKTSQQVNDVLTMTCENFTGVIFDTVFDISNVRKLLDFMKVGQVLHLLSLQDPNVRPTSDALPTAAMNDGPPSPEFTTTPALPCRERRIRLGWSALGEVTRSAVCADLACDLVCVGIFI